MTLDAAPRGDAVPHGNWGEAQRKERIIYDMIEVLPPPRNEPVSESDFDSEDDDSQSESGDSDESDGSGNDDGTMREPTIETEPFVSAPSSPRHPDPEIQTQRVWKPKLAPFDPVSYISAKNEAAKRGAHSHISYAYKMDTTIWSELAERQNYRDAINNPIEWE